MLEKIRTDGVEAYDDTLTYIRAARAQGLRTAIVSSSANCRDVLRAIDAEDLFDVRIDGVVAAERKLPGKPHPDTFLAAAHDLGLDAPAPPSSRTPSPAWTPAAREASGTSSASTASDRPTPCTSTARTSS